MPNQDIRNLIFDCGKTLHGYNLDRFFNWLERRFGTPRHFFWGMFSRYPDGILYPYECGLSTEKFVELFWKENLRLLFKFGEKERKIVVMPEFSNKEFVENWNLVLDPWPMDREIISFLRKLKHKGYGLYVLSNTNRAHLLCIRRFAGELFETIDRFISSCDYDVRCRKMRPDLATKDECEKIFWKAIEISGFDPEETAFVDDTSEFVDVFNGMGGHGIHHRGSWTRTESELYNLGVRW